MVFLVGTVTPILNFAPFQSQICRELFCQLKVEGCRRYFSQYGDTYSRTLKLITALINQSIETSAFPKLWKTAIIRPISKINLPSHFKDLRLLKCFNIHVKNRRKVSVLAIYRLPGDQRYLAT